MVMVEENKNRWNELPITIRRRVTPEQLGHSFNLVLLMSGPICDHIYETTPEDERLDKYLNSMIHQLVLKNLDYIWTNHFQYTLMYRIFYDALIECYRDELTLEFKKHDRNLCMTHYHWK